ncbi:MAG: ABC transporter substrate-binding protein, partial [Planctomycetota bacterium]
MALLLVALVACRPADRPVVVLYVSADEHVAREVVSAFEAETGIDVLVVGDTEAKKTTGLVQRLRREADNPQADVFWSSEIFQTVALAQQGVLGEHLSDATVDWPIEFRDPERRWYGFAARARVIVFAPDRVPAERVPRSWMDLTDPAWRGRVVMADPRFGTTGGHLGAMKSYWGHLMHGEAYYEAFLLGLADNEVRLLPSGNAGVVRAVA